MQETQETWVHTLIGKIPWRRKWQPPPVFLPGKFHGQKSLTGYSLWGCKESDMTECMLARAHIHTHAHTPTHLSASTHRIFSVQGARVYVACSWGPLLPHRPPESPPAWPSVICAHGRLLHHPSLLSRARPLRCCSPCHPSHSSWTLSEHLVLPLH